MQAVHLSSTFALLKTFSWQELRHHPWQNAAAVAAVMLGVALAFAVHVINASALEEFAQGLRAVNGQPDVEFRGASGVMDEALYTRIANHPDVAQASPVLEINSYALGAQNKRQPLRILGVDALLVYQVSPTLMPLPTAGANRFAVFAPDAIFLNAAAQAALAFATSGQPGAIEVQAGLQLQTLRVAGTIATPGAPAAVMDLAAAQEVFGRIGALSRVDVKLKTGVGRAAFLNSVQGKGTGSADWPPELLAQTPADALDRASNLSRAYRVNMTVLAFVALFTGAFLVYSVLSLSVAKRGQQFALLGVLGLTRPERLKLVLMESAALGLVGSLLGIALGSGLASAALSLLGGDLGGGYFSSGTPALQWNAWAAAGYGACGLLAALAGGWRPAKAAAGLQPALALKGLAATGDATRMNLRSLGVALVLLASCALLATAPPIFDLPLAAYFAVGFLLLGGVTLLPVLIAALLWAVKPLAQKRLLGLLALERARRMGGGAAAAIGGVVAALSLAVALTVMVASFREAVTQWLDVVLPADLYLRTANSTLAGEVAFFTPEAIRAVVATPGVARVATQRTRLLQFDAARPAVALISRDLKDVARALPLVSDPLAVPAGRIGVYVSEAMADLYDARPGQEFFKLNRALGLDKSAQTASFFIAGVWRDYARQAGSLALDRADYERLTGDTQVNDLAVWLDAGSNSVQVRQALRASLDARGGAPNAGQLVEFASAGEIRAISLKIFDRSFAVTYWLQAVAVGIGLFGVAASFSAQVLSRRKEFGLLAHLGLTRRQVLTVVAGEGLAWTGIGAFAGLALGLAVAVILVHVVNPQSFHWTMALAVPWARLGLLCLAVVAAGTVTAWFAGRAAAGKSAVLAVKEDW